MDFVIVDFSKKVTPNMLVTAISKNYQTAILMEREINKLESISTQGSHYCEQAVIDREVIDPFYEDNQKNTDLDTSFEEEVDYYLSLIKSLADTDITAEKMKSNLPNSTTNNYNNIILRLKVDLLKEIKEIKDFIEENDNILFEDDVEEFKQEIESYQKKLDVLSRKMEQEDFTVESQEENHLFFAITSGGNIRALDEMEKIAKTNPEYCASFLGLFQSIQDGSFKNVKRFSTVNNRTVGVAEVRDFKTRVVFDRIGEHDYAIVTAFIKKSDNDKGYLESMELRIQKYLRQKDSMISNLSNDEYRMLHQQYTEELYRNLGRKDENTSPKVFKLGGGASNV